MNGEPKSGYSARIEEAAEWYIRLRTPEADNVLWASFVLWLEADPANRSAYEAVEDADMEVGRLTSAGSIGAREGTNLAHFPRPAPARRRAMVWSPWAVMAAATIVLFVTMRGQMPTTTEYETRFGETKSIALSDGSAIELNSNTAMRIGQGTLSRTVFFDRGEAFFRIRTDSRNPFTIHVGDQVVRDIGTRFDVLRVGRATTVSVVEGRVGVLQAGASSRATILSEGDQLFHVDGSKKAAVARIDPDEVLSWRQGYLIYRNVPLSQVVGDLNRYFATQIVLAGPAVADQKFSGVLKFDDEDAVLRRICAFLPVTVERADPARITLRMAAQSH